LHGKSPYNDMGFYFGITHSGIPISEQTEIFTKSALKYKSFIFFVYLINYRIILNNILN